MSVPPRWSRQDLFDTQTRPTDRPNGPGQAFFTASGAYGIFHRHGLFLFGLHHRQKAPPQHAEEPPLSLHTTQAGRTRTICQQDQVRANGNDACGLYLIPSPQPVRHLRQTRIRARRILIPSWSAAHCHRPDRRLPHFDRHPALRIDGPRNCRRRRCGDRRQRPCGYGRPAQHRGRRFNLCNFCGYRRSAPANPNFVKRYSHRVRATQLT